MTVTSSNADVPADVDGDAGNGNQPTLTFAAADWNTARTVTVRAAQDADRMDDAVTWTHAPDGANYAGVADVRLAFTVNDDDVRAAAMEDRWALSGWEEYDVVTTSLLATETRQRVRLVRGAVANWGGAQIEACEWTAVQPGTPGTSGACEVIKDPGDDDRSISHTATLTVLPNMIANGGVVIKLVTAGTAVMTEWVPLDGAIAPAPTSLTLREGDASRGSGTYTVRLIAAPGGNVTVRVASSDPGAVTAAPGALTFTTTSWNTARTVTVRAVPDADGDEETVTVTQTAASRDARGSVRYDARTAGVTVTVRERAGLEVNPQAVTVPEAGATGSTYTVALTNRPGGPVTVRVQVPAEVAAAPGALTFTAGTWDTGQTVTVTATNAADDADAADAAVAVRHAVASSAAGYAYPARTGEGVTVTIEDDETPAIVLSASALTVSEGTSPVASYTVRLGLRPSGGVRVLVRRGFGSVGFGVQPAGTTEPQHFAYLDFTAANWNTGQAVTVVALDDADAAGQTVTIGHTVELDGEGTTAEGYRTARPFKNLPVTVVDDEAVIAVSRGTGALPLTEGSSATYTVALGGPPAGSVVVDVTSADAGAVTLAPGALTFAATTWNTGQPVTVRAEQDVDVDAETVEVRHAVDAAGSTGDFDVAPDVTFPVSVTDDDTRGLDIGATALTADGVDEGSTATYTLALAAQPTGPVTVTVTSSNADVPADVDGDANNGNQPTLTFTAADWNTARTVTVRAAEDDDGGDDAVTWTHAPDGANYAGAAGADLTFTVNDDDVPGVTVDTDPATPAVADTAALAVTEGGGAAAAAAYTVVLDTLPTGPVTVTVTSGEPGAVTAAPGALTFTAADWNTARTVTARAENDADGAAETVTLSHAPTGAAEYREVTVADVAVRTTDDDVPTIVLSERALSLSEVVHATIPRTATYTVRLGLVPAGDVRVRVTRGDARYTVRKAGGTGTSSEDLDFTTSDWNTGQTITVTTIDDSVLSTLGPVSNVTHETVDANSAAEYRPVSKTLPVTLRDDEQVLEVRPTRLAVTEGESGTYTVRLRAGPASGAVTVTVAAPANTDVTRAPGSLTFAAAAWNTAQTVTVTVAGDADGLDETATLSHTAAGDDNAFDIPTARPAENVTVTVTDDDRPGVRVDTDPGTPGGWVTGGSPALTVGEAASADYTLALNVQPAGPVTVTASSGAAAVTLDADGSPRTRDLTFTTTTWDTAQTVTVTAGSDADGRDERVEITHTVRSADPDYRQLEGDDGTGVPRVAVTVDDADTPAVAVDTDPATPAVVDTAALGVSEDGTMTTDAYTVVLATQPAGPVTVTAGDDPTATPGVNDLDKVRVAPGTLTFTAETWDTAQTVTVAGREDDDGLDDTVSLAHAATSGDADYAGLAVAAVEVAVTDDDVPGLAVSTTALAVDEPETGTAAGTYAVRLQTEPGGAVTVGVAAPANPDVTASPGSLTFAAAAWNTARTVTVTVAADDDAADDTATLAHTVTGTGDATDYPTTLAAVTVTVAVADADAAGVTVSATAFALTEDHATDGSGTYTVVLAAAPTAPLTVTVTSDDGAVAVDTDATPQTRALTFGSTNWNTAQAVTATAAADEDAVDERATITHALAGAAEYAGSAGPPVVAAVPAASVAVTVDDDEEQGLTFDPAAMVTVPEDGATTYTAVLTSAPTAPMVVRIGSDDAAVDAQPRLLQYTAMTWDTAQAVTVLADADADARAGMATLTHTAAGGDYTGLAAETLAVNVTDDDAGVVVSRRGLTVVAGSTNTYTVGLAAQPAGPVTVTVTGSDTDVAAVGPSQNPASRAVVFTAGNWQTAQAVPVTGTGAGAATLSHAVSGYGMGTTADSVAVTVVGTGARLLIDPLVLRVLEGGPDGTYTVRLGTEPGGPVTVTVGAASNVNSAITRAPGALTFDATSWGTAQAVTVTPGTDLGTTPGTATVAHTVTGYGSVTSGPTVTVTEVEDLTPTLGAVAAQTYRAGQAVNVRLPAATEGNPPVTYALTGPLPATDLTLPAGLTFEAATRRLRGTPQMAATAATYRLTATDADGDAAPQDFTVTVAANPLTFGTATVQTERHPLNRAVEQQLPLPTVTGTPVLTFVVEPALPAGLTYEPPARDTGTGLYPHGGRIVGTPTVRTPQRQYRLTVVDAANNEAQVTFALATGARPAPPPAPEPADRQPTFGDATVEVQRYAVGTAVMLALPAATGGDPPLGYTLTPADLPAGLTYTPPAAAAATGGTLAGTPVAVHPATTYTLTATDADGDTATLTFAVEVGAAGAIRPREGTTTYTVNGQRVTVTQAPGTLAGVALTVTEPARLDRALTITVQPPGADVPLVRGGYGFGPAGAPAVVDLAVAPVPAGGLDVCLPVSAGLRTAAGAVVLVRYTGQQWEPVADTTGDAAAGQVCAAGMTAFGPLGAGYANAVPTFGDRTVGALELQVDEAHAVALPAATDGDGDTATLGFTLAVVRTPVRVTLLPGTAEEGRPVEFAVTLSRAVTAPLTLDWTAGQPGSATPGEDYRAVAAGETTLAAGAAAGTLTVRTLDDRRVEPTETFTVRVTLPADSTIELAQDTVEGRIEDDDTERARKRSVGMVLAGVGRTLATDAVDVIGDRFVRPPGAAQATVGGQALALERGPQRGRWRHAAGVAYGVARALGVEVGSPLAGGDGQFGQVRGAAWSTLTRHLRDPHTPTPPLSARDAPGAFAAAPGPGWNGPSSGWGSPHAPGGSPARQSPASGFPFEHPHLPGLAGYGPGLGQRGFDRAHAATPQAVQVGALRAPVQFRRVSGAEVLSQSQFELPLSRPAPLAVASATEGTPAAGPPIEPAAQAGAAAWTLWGRGTASGFDGRPKDDFSMDGNVFTGYLGVDYRLQPNILLGLAVAHSQGDVDYETMDVTKGDVDVTLTSVLPYAHWSPQPGLGVWGLFGAGWGDLQLRDEAGRVKTDLEMLLGAVGARQEVLTWRQIDVALKADAFLTELEAGADDRLPETAGDAQRLRLMVEGRTAWAMSEDSHLTPVFEIGGRWDGGKAETGVGAEMGGGFEYAHPKLGLGIEARGRYLLAHQKSAFDEWGASLTLRLDPGAARRGLWLSLAPVWGAEASQVEQMWGSAEALRAGAETDQETAPGLAPDSVELDVGYGVVAHEGAGLLTTYGGVSLAGPGSRGVRLGGSLAVGEWIDLSVEGERTTQQGGGAEHQVALYGHLCW